MIIRSQDKRKIETFKRADVDYGCRTVFVNGLPFGEYSTEEKAIKVLDDICVFANGLHFEAIATDQCGRLDGVVFQMPQDSEI